MEGGTCDLELLETLLTPNSDGTEEADVDGPEEHTKTHCRLYSTDLRHAYRVQLYLWSLKDFSWMRGWGSAPYFSAVYVVA